MQDEIVDKIKKAQDWASERYQIDQQLIEAGYKPADIDTAWGQINQSTKIAKPRIEFKFLSSPKLWLWIINILLIVGFCTLIDSISYYWIRIISNFAFFLNIILVGLGIILTKVFRKALKPRSVALMYWLWGTVVFSTVCSTAMLQSVQWQKKEELNTPTASYYYIEKRTSSGETSSGLYFRHEYYEIHKCQFIVWCNRIDHKHIIPDGERGIPNTQEGRMQILMNNLRLDTNEKK